MKKRLLLLTMAMVLSLSTMAVSVETDRPWYLAGEALRVSISVDDGLIAYAELCDTRRLAAGTIVSLQEGRGEGIIELPSDLHSGYYVLSVYTRHDARVAHQLVAVVNALSRSVDDDMQWVAVARPDSMSYAAIAEGSRFAAAVDLVDVKPVDVRETEGHVIWARVTNALNGQTFRGSEIRPSLSIVGKQIHFFEGKMVDDTLAVFFTYGLHGKLPLVLSAATSTGKSLPIEIVSPFAALLPKQLPHLVFHYNRSEVETRSLSMQRHQKAIAREEGGGPLDYDESLLGTKPDPTYNLDEYRQFRTVREVLTEYVNCVKKTKTDGLTKLVVRRPQDNYTSIWPAMVLIDGMPVIDTQRLLDYDARRVHYINVYGGQYTFGNGVYNGILSFVTRSGQLTNYPTEPGAQYLVYEFPL